MLTDLSTACQACGFCCGNNVDTKSPEPFGVMIESKEVADTQRAIFEMAWRGIKQEKS